MEEYTKPIFKRVSLVTQRVLDPLVGCQNNDPLSSTYISGNPASTCFKEEAACYAFKH